MDSTQRVKSLASHIPLMVLFILLLTWPLAWKYTSFGIDLEAPNGPMIECTFYRIRWPGDGSIMFGRIDEPHRADRKPLERFDLGGVFLHPAMELHPKTMWNRMGFRWVNYDKTRDGGVCDESPHAARTWLAGFPHGVIILAAAAGVVWTRKRKQSRQSAGESES